MTSQIRFSRNNDGSYANMFDVRTRAMITDEDFKTYIANTNDEAELVISKVGFVYSKGSNHFSTEDAKKVAQGEHIDGYADAPVSYIQDADGYYIFTCLVVDIPVEDIPEYVNQTLLTWNGGVESSVVATVDGKEIKHSDVGAELIAAEREAIQKELDEITNKYDIDGIECYHSIYTEEQIKLLLEFSKRKNLLISGGTDYHGRNKKDLELGTGRGNLQIPEKILNNWKIRNLEKEENIRQIKYHLHKYIDTTKYGDFVRIYKFEHELRLMLLKYTLIISKPLFLNFK